MEQEKIKAVKEWKTPTKYTKLQPHCQVIKQTKRQERVEIGRGTPKGI